MPSYRLHYFPESGNSYKLALMLTLCGQRFEPVWTDFGGGVTRTPEWRRDVNEMGEIPVLEVDGERLTQTAPILLKLARQFGRFGGETEQEQFEMLRWLFWDNHKLTGYMATYRYNRTFTPSPDEAVQKYFRRRLDDFLSILEAAHAEELIRDRRTADGGGYFHDGLSALSRRRDRIRLGFEPSRDPRLAWAHGAIAGLEIGLRPVARQAADALRQVTADT